MMIITKDKKKTITLDKILQNIKSERSENNEIFFVFQEIFGFI